MTYRASKLPRPLLVELLATHGHEYEFIASLVGLRPSTVKYYASCYGLVRNPQPKSTPASVGRPKDSFSEGRLSEQEIDWSAAPIAKRYGLWATKYNTLGLRPFILETKEF